MEQKSHTDIALNGERSAPRESEKFGGSRWHSKQVKQIPDIADVGFVELHKGCLELLSENETHRLPALAGSIVGTYICEANGGFINGDCNLELIRILRSTEKQQITPLANESRRRSGIAIPLTRIFHSHYAVAKNTNL